VASGGEDTALIWSGPPREEVQQSVYEIGWLWEERGADLRAGGQGGYLRALEIKLGFMPRCGNG